MSPNPFGRRRRHRRVISLLASLVAAAAVLTLTSVGFGPLPALGQALNPRSGIWSEARAGATPSDRVVTLPTLDDPVTIGFDADGNPNIDAASDVDAYQAIGYLHGTDRLFQMELMRRQASGRLSEVIGPGGLESDTFQTELGLSRIADADWASLPDDAPARTVLTAYAEGVNQAIDERTAAGTLPLEFKVMGFSPTRWQPSDSLLIQRLMAQTLSLNSRAPGFSIMAEALGKDRLLEYVPEYAAMNRQFPVDPGPYEKLPLTKPPVLDDVTVTQAEADGSTVEAAGSGATEQAPTGDRILAATSVIARLDGLPDNAVHQMSNSNAWAVSGEHTASGGAVLATDPHLEHTIPAIWYQVEASAPGFQVAGVTIPGVPAVVLGKNADISWGLTNSQHQQAFFYNEHTDPQRPDQYYWNGHWRAMEVRTETIPVKGGEPVEHTVRSTVHGPIINVQGQAVSLWWTGSLSSRSIDSLLELATVDDFDHFHEALRGWGAPAQNFVYADRKGNVGSVNAGYMAQVESGDAFLPLSGTGKEDVAGLVPFDAQPLTYNPPGGVVVSANQREVTEDYPYYWGTAYDYFDPGWRAEELHRNLDGSTGIDLTSTQELQLDVHDSHARLLVPLLLEAMEGEEVDADERWILDQMRSWDYEMRADEVAPTVLKNLLNRFCFETFGPWWNDAGVPRDPEDSLLFGADHGSEVAEVLRPTMTELARTSPDDPIFSLPDGTQRDAQDVIRVAFHGTVDQLTTKFGDDPSTWTYGQVNRRLYASLTQTAEFDVPAFETDGSNRTIDAIAGHLFRDGKPLLGIGGGGPSWRFAVDWGVDQAVWSYPGGQSENHLSDWRTNKVEEFGSGDLPTIHEGQADEAATKGRTWTLQPQG